MKFLIQKIDGEIRHDFSFVLLEAIRFRDWLHNSDKIQKRFFDTTENQTEFQFKDLHEKYVPVGSVEFVSAFIEHFYGLHVKPINVPEELFGYGYCRRDIFNGNHMDLEDREGKFFIKSNDKIKGFSQIIEYYHHPVYKEEEQYKKKYRLEELNIPIGHYQISEYLTIDSEWRAFVYDGKLVGLQNYSGDFTMFPNVRHIKQMIRDYKSAPIAYTLDIGVRKNSGNEYSTFVIECHDFFSCGLYGFSDLAIYPQMLHRWFWQYIQREMVNQNWVGKKIKN